MKAADYIPSDDKGRLGWLANLDAYLVAHGLARGFSAGEIAAFTAQNGIFSGDFVASETAKAAARAAVQTKNTSLRATIKLARSYVMRLQAFPATTDADRAAARVTVPDRTPTQPDPDYMNAIPPPLLLLLFGQRGQVTGRWGPNPGDENHNGRPERVIGCEIQVARGGIPTDPSVWTALQISPQSPFVFVMPDTVPTTYAFRARYVGKNLKFGVFCDPVVCTISV